MSIDDAKKYEEQMKLPNLTFVTHTNQSQLRAAPEMQSYFEKADKEKRETDEGVN